MDARRAGGRIERELLILTRHLEMTSPRRVRLDHNALDRSAYVLLSRLEAQGPMSVPALVDAFGLTPSTLTRQTTALLRDGLVERTLDPDGSIARQFRITEEGRKRLRTDRDAIASGLADVLGDWPEDRLRRFVEDLERFNTDIEERTGRPWPR
ncbi:MarR family winged helix-turn-helix transcriptional regulator [Streptomyces sp. NPDC051684]|uniref:MarR family winged helix-turn-helix transcriptional regulator n=1 Tax=Streptomyces sp. NPDC051684 TaxID=3365670 RepID=UPI0037B7ED16